ncbi:MAG: DUF4058 family protein [Anaerolineae bacterium]
MEEEEEESAIFIREADTERLVTVVEILSYSNKAGGVEKRARYMVKRRELLSNGVHLVEIDINRGRTPSWGWRRKAAQRRKGITHGPPAQTTPHPCDPQPSGY